MSDDDYEKILEILYYARYWVLNQRHRPPRTALEQAEALDDLSDILGGVIPSEVQN